jgi:hypothetical protein
LINFPNFEILKLSQQLHKSKWNNFKFVQMFLY